MRQTACSERLSIVRLRRDRPRFHLCCRGRRRGFRNRLLFASRWTLVTSGPRRESSWPCRAPRRRRLLFLRRRRCTISLATSLSTCAVIPLRRTLFFRVFRRTFMDAVAVWPLATRRVSGFPPYIATSWSSPVRWRTVVERQVSLRRAWVDKLLCLRLYFAWLTVCHC